MKEKLQNLLQYFGSMIASKPTVTKEAYSLGHMYFLQDVRQIEKRFDEYTRTLKQKGYNILIDPVTALSLLSHIHNGYAPLSSFRFGAIAVKDSPLAEEILQQKATKTLKDLVKEDATKLSRDMLGTVIMELDTYSRRLFAYIDENGDYGEAAHNFRSALFPDDGSKSLINSIGGHDKFILGIVAIYYPHLLGSLENTNLHLFPTEAVRRYSESDLQKVDQTIRVINILKDRKGISEEFPDKAVAITSNTAEEAYNAVDGIIKRIHGVASVRYFPFLIEKEIDADTIGDLLVELVDGGFMAKKLPSVEDENERMRAINSLKDLIDLRVKRGLEGFLINTVKESLQRMD